MDTEEIRNRIIRLNEEIEEVLLKAGYPKCCVLSPERGDSDADAQTLEVIAHLGYVNSIVKEWHEQ